MPPFFQSRPLARGVRARTTVSALERDFRYGQALPLATDTFVSTEEDNRHTYWCKPTSKHNPTTNLTACRARFEDGGAFTPETTRWSGWTLSPHADTRPHREPRRDRKHTRPPDTRVNSKQTRELLQVLYALVHKHTDTSMHTSVRACGHEVTTSPPSLRGLGDWP
jgi:hypothetical protein